MHLANPRTKSWLRVALYVWLSILLSSNLEAAPSSNLSPKKIITLSPHLAEVISELGAIDELVGVSDASNYPSSVKKIKVVANFQSINLELIKQLNPDIILIWKSGTSAKQQLALQNLFKNSKTQLIETDANSLADIASEFERLGKIIGKESQGMEIASKFRKNLLAIEMQNRNKSLVSVFYQAWPSPLMTINGQHLISDMIKVCGGKQIFADQKLLVPTVSIESVIQLNPEVILSATQAEESPLIDNFSIWKNYPNLKVNQLKGYLNVNGDTMTRPSSRALLATQEICTFLDAIRARKSNQ